MKAHLTPVLFLISLFSVSVFADEPSYCDPQTFLKTEISSQVSGVSRLHLFKIGGFTLAGLAIGDTPADTTIKLAQHYSSTTAEDKYCTYYVNSGNQEATKDFVYEPLSKPGGNATKDATEYITKMGPYLDQASTNFVKCAQTRGYVAIGCDGMKHRGPSVFGMLLAYSGCTAQHSLDIVDQLWGLNGVPAATRLAIIQTAYDRGVQDNAQSTLLRNILLGLAH